MSRIRREDYLKRIGGSRAPQPSREQNAAPEWPVYDLAGRLILRELGGAPAHSETVFQVLEALGSTITEVLPVVEWLEQKGFVRIDQPKPRNGDWKLTLTDQGGKFLQTA